MSEFYSQDAAEVVLTMLDSPDSVDLILSRLRELAADDVRASSGEPDAHSSPLTLAIRLLAQETPVEIEEVKRRVRELGQLEEGFVHDQSQPLSDLDLPLS